MNAHSPNQSLARALGRAGLVDADGVPLVTPHGLRHTAASLMLAAGVPLIVVSRQLGHANPNVTAQVYAHLLADSQLDEAAAAFSGLGSPSDHVDGDVVGAVGPSHRRQIPTNARHPARAAWMTENRGVPSSSLGLAIVRSPAAAGLLRVGCTPWHRQSRQQVAPERMPITSETMAPTMEDACATAPTAAAKLIRAVVSGA